MTRLKDRAARAVNSLLARANLAVVRRDRHDAMVEAQVRRERQALGRDARPLAESLRTLDPTSAGLLLARVHDLGTDVGVLGRGTEARLLADALRASGRTATLHDPGQPETLPTATDLVVVEPPLGKARYELVQRLRADNG